MRNANEIFRFHQILCSYVVILIFFIKKKPYFFARKYLLSAPSSDQTAFNLIEDNHSRFHNVFKRDTFIFLIKLQLDVHFDANAKFYLKFKNKCS